ncbi:MAG: hypothetical protein V1897_13215 [Pseudomonadota bacterium]
MKFYIILGSVLLAMFNLSALTFASDQTCSIIANQQVSHILDDSPFCSGIAPQKSQNADIPLRASLSNKDHQGLEVSSKTDMKTRLLKDELTGRIIQD